MGRIRNRLKALLHRKRHAEVVPFVADMTIDEAWHNHPGAPAIFALHHLPSCDGCAVRHDETLAEAASAYGIDLVEWLEQLNKLHTIQG